MNPLTRITILSLSLVLPCLQAHSGETASKTFTIGYTVPATISQNLALNQSNLKPLTKPDFLMTEEVRTDKDRGRIIVRSLVLL